MIGADVASHVEQVGDDRRGGRLGTRAGTKLLTLTDDGLVTADMGRARVLGETAVSVGPATWSSAITPDERQRKRSTVAE